MFALAVCLGAGRGVPAAPPGAPSLRRPGLGAQAQLSPQLSGQLRRRRDPLAEMGNSREAPVRQRPPALTCPLARSRPLPCARRTGRPRPAEELGRLLPAPAPAKPGASQPGSEIMQIPGGSLIKSLTRRWGRARGGAESRGHAPEGPGPSATGGPRAPPGAWEPPRRRRGRTGQARLALPGMALLPRGRGRTCGPSCGPGSRGRRGRGRGGRGSGPRAPLSDACCWANSRGRGRVKGPD